MKIKRTVAHKFAGEYHGEYSPTDIVEMAIIHELCHVITHPMSQWVHNTITSMRIYTALEKHFIEQEEISVEHLARILFGMKDFIEPSKKFAGKIVYLTKDPDA